MIFCIIMIEIETKVRKWGNSLAMVIPNDIAEKANLKAGKEIKIFLPLRKVRLSQEFGSLKNWKTPTEKIMKDIDEGW